MTLDISLRGDLMVHAQIDSGPGHACQCYRAEGEMDVLVLYDVLMDPTNPSAGIG